MPIATFAILLLQGFTLVGLLWAARRRSADAERASALQAFVAKLETLLAADLPGQLARDGVRAELLERHLREELGNLRREGAESAVRGREAAEAQAAVLRGEILSGLQGIRTALQAGLDSAQAAERADAERLRGALEAQVGALGQRLGQFTTDTHKAQTEDREALHTHLHALGRAHGEHQDRLRTAVEGRLDKLNEANAAKLEEMRATVDEKLHATLQTRLTESFGSVTEHLSRVHTGLGEMSKLSSDVSDLSRIFTNVKSRGGFAEVQLGMLLGQMLAPNQFGRNVKVKPGTGEMVEYAVKLPTPEGEILLPVDAKFPREAWERLESAYAAGATAEVAVAGRAFETALRTEAKRICEKYIAPPATTNFAIMFLPTEGLYAEVMRRDGLQSDLQGTCRVTIAGPSTLSALLNSFQMGFHLLDMQKKGDEVWKVLAKTKDEFLKFEGLMAAMEKQVGTVQNTIEKLNTRTRVINRSLRDVSLEDQEPALPSGEVPNLLGKVVPLLTAAESGHGG